MPTQKETLRQAIDELAVVTPLLTGYVPVLKADGSVLGKSTVSSLRIPGGTPGQVLFNNAGALGGIPGSSFDTATNTLSFLPVFNSLAGSSVDSFTFGAQVLGQDHDLNSYYHLHVIPNISLGVRSAGYVYSIESAFSLYAEAHPTTDSVTGYATGVFSGMYMNGGESSISTYNKVDAFHSYFEQQKFFGNRIRFAAGFYDEHGYLSPWNGSDYGTETYVSFYAESQAGMASNVYYFWADSRGVYRIKEDSALDGGNAQAITALYNPRFAKYTAGAADYERIVQQWNTNVAEIGLEKGGTGTLRNLRLLGKSLFAGGDTFNYTNDPATLEPFTNNFHCTAMVIAPELNSTVQGGMYPSTISGVFGCKFDAKVQTIPTSLTIANGFSGQVTINGNGDIVNYAQGMLGGVYMYGDGHHHKVIGFASYSEAGPPNALLIDEISAFYAWAPFLGVATATVAIAYYAEDLAGIAANSYYFWADSRGVYRIKEDNSFDGVGQAITALYNPQFAKYVAGAANYERIIQRWNGNVGEYGVENGGTGTLRQLRLLGAGVDFSGPEINYTPAISMTTASQNRAGFNPVYTVDVDFPGPSSGFINGFNFGPVVHTNEKTIFGVNGLNAYLTLQGIGHPTLDTVRAYANGFGASVTILGDQTEPSLQVPVYKNVNACTAYVEQFGGNSRVNLLTLFYAFESLSFPWDGVEFGTDTFVSFYSEEQGVGKATNVYYFWLDSRGVYRIKEDNSFDGVGQAIMAFYNPQFAKYVPGAANYERIVQRWNGNVGEYGVEKGGTGTLRNLRLLGAGVEIPEHVAIGPTAAINGSSAFHSAGTYQVLNIAETITTQVSTSTGVDKELFLLGAVMTLDPDITVPYSNHDFNAIQGALNVIGSVPVTFGSIEVVDSVLQYSGPHHSGGVTGFQSTMYFTDAGGDTLGAFAFNFYGSHSGSGTIVEWDGLRIPKILGAGPITNACGVRVGNHAGRGTSTSYNIVSEGATSVNLFEGRVIAGAPNSAIADGALANGQWSAYLDEAGDKLTFKVKYAGGSVKTGTVALV